VVTAIDHGIVEIRGALLPKVNYLLFEVAEHGDIRKALQLGDGLGLAAKLRSIHNVATGLKQLHRINIAHQDMKPSNVLMFAGEHPQRPETAKIADLGRAHDPNLPAPHDVFPIAGDRTYAPPEQLYRATPIEYELRRLACDVYQLGSLTCFIFLGIGMNAMLAGELHPSHHWTRWGDSYEDVLPYVRDAFGRVLRSIRTKLPYSVSDELTDLISYLCDPDPTLRGHPGNARAGSRNLDLERVVTRLDLMAKRAEIEILGGH
jgi:serine/threonine protein kinase